MFNLLFKLGTIKWEPGRPLNLTFIVNIHHPASCPLHLFSYRHPFARRDHCAHSLLCLEIPSSHRRAKHEIIQINVLYHSPYRLSS